MDGSEWQMTAAAALFVLLRSSSCSTFCRLVLGVPEWLAVLRVSGIVLLVSSDASSTDAGSGPRFILTVAAIKCQRQCRH